MMRGPSQLLLSQDHSGIYLCHRGVSPFIVREIAEVFRERDSRGVMVQHGDGLSLSLAQFRRIALDHMLADDGNDLIVLVSGEFPGPAFHQTFGGDLKWASRSWYGEIFSIRVDDCEIGNALLSADIAGIKGRAERRDILLRCGARRYHGTEGFAQ